MIWNSLIKIKKSTFTLNNAKSRKNLNVFTFLLRACKNIFYKYNLGGIFSSNDSQRERKHDIQFKVLVVHFE